MFNLYVLFIKCRKESAIWKVICYIQVPFKAGLTLIYSLMVEGKIFSAEYASLLFPNSQNHPIHAHVVTSIK